MASESREPMSDARVVRVVMPQMGESLSEGTIVRWLKQPGERIGHDEPLFELSTDKVDTEVPAPAAGVVKAILAAEGETVSVGSVVALIEIDQTQTGTSPAAASAPVVQTAAVTAEEPSGHFKSSHAPQLVSFRRDDAAGPTQPNAPAAVDTAAPSVTAARLLRVIVPNLSPANRSFSPAVLEDARRAGMAIGQLTSVQGSGRGGRITKRDVQRFLDAGGGQETPLPSRRVAGGVDARVQQGPPPEYVHRPTPDDRLVPMSPVRKRIARHMRWSVRISPHATAQGEADMSAIAAMLEHREAFREQTGVPVTYTVCAAAATVHALRDFPVLNSSVVGDQIAFKPYVNLGVAVALGDSDELIVPVVRGAENLTLVGIARAMHDLVVRARARKLSPADVQGGTFTLTNPGVFGGITGTPILNQPQVGILGLGAVRKQAVVVDDAVVVRPMMALALTFDHRATDGMMAFRFLARMRELLETPPGDWHWTK